jgi:tetratricopeptide (TPR) repeat protein
LLGETYLGGKQYSQALTEFKAAQELAPNSARVMSNLGWAYFKTDKTDQGLQWLKKAQALNPDNPKINHRLGMVFAAQKKYPEALAAFRKGGDEAQALNNIGVHYYLDRRYAEAARCFQKALEVRPTFYQEAKVNLGKALARLQEEKPAEEESHHSPPGRISLKSQSPSTAALTSH